MKFIKIEEKENIATVWLNRAEVRNAFNPEMISELTRAFENFHQKKNITAVVLRGEGKSFCAGADLTWMKDMVNYSLPQNKKDAENLFEMFQSIFNCPAPIIGVCHGAAFGGALGLLACCDYVICEEKTQLCFSEVKLGIAPAVISLFVLKKCVPGLVQALMISGHVFSAQQAMKSGLVHAICDEESLPDQLESCLGWFRQASPTAVRATKKLLQNLNSEKDFANKQAATQLIAELRVSAEGQEGLRSFLQKRPPQWGQS